MSLLVALDTTDPESQVVVTAKRLAAALQSKLWLLHVAEPEPDFVGYDVGPQSVRDGMAKHFHTEHRLIQSLADKLRGEGVDASALLVQGSFAETILAQASKLNAAYIVVGAHKKGIFRHLLFGSTSDAIIHQSSVPVIVVPL